MKKLAIAIILVFVFGSISMASAARLTVRNTRVSYRGPCRSHTVKRSRVAWRGPNRTFVHKKTVYRRGNQRYVVKRNVYRGPRHTTVVKRNKYAVRTPVGKVTVKRTRVYRW